MLTPPTPEDLSGVAAIDPVALLAVLATGWVYAIGWARTTPARRPSRMRLGATIAGLLVLAVAVASPLHVAADALVSAHMVQHVLLLAVAPPLLAVGHPMAVLLRGTPPTLRRRVARLRGRVGVTTTRTRKLWRPVPTWLLVVATLWLWHAAGPYEAALANPLLHVLEHASFLLAGLAFAGLVAGASGAAPIGRGTAMLMVFAASVPTVFLAVLMTFAPTTWYPTHAAAAVAWGLDPLGDQHLAGVLMWVPMGAVSAASVLVLLAGWLRDVEAAEALPVGRVGEGRTP